MRIFAILFVVALIAAGAYGYYNDPGECLKLCSDVARDAPSIFIPNGNNDSAPPVPVAPPAPQHYSMGFQIPDAPATTTTAQPVRHLRRSNYGEYTDYFQALGVARSNNVPLLIYFTGSDWCPVCQMIDQEVMSSSEFQQYRASHFVFMTVDDLHETPMSDDEKKRVNELTSRFRVTGYPTLLLLDGRENELGRIAGYQPGLGADGIEKNFEIMQARAANASASASE